MGAIPAWSLHADCIHLLRPGANGQAHPEKPVLSDDPLSRRFEQLESETDARRRGREFEALVEALFRSAHWRVERNVGAARPRQTDIFASYGRDHFLIETKHQRAKCDIDDIGALRDRLARTAPTVVGVLVSMSGFTAPAVDDVEARRDRPVLLVNRAELVQLLSGQIEIMPLLRTKHHSLVRDGRAHLTAVRSAPRVRVRTRADQLTVAEIVYIGPDGHRQPWVSCGGGFDRTVFVQELPDVDWGPFPDSHGVVARFDVSLRGDQEDLLNVLVQLERLGWVTRNARWAIDQSSISWHGAGAREFWQALVGWKQRYERLERWHHTEAISYYDVCGGGFYTLEAQLRAGEPRSLYHCNFAMQLPGVPLDPEPFRHLQGVFSSDQSVPVHFRSLAGPSVSQVPDLDDDTLEVLAEVVDSRPFGLAHEDEWVTGIVVKNPYIANHAGGSRARERQASWPTALLESEVLVCDLGSHHHLNEQRRAYRLTRIEFASTYDVTVIRPVADWD